MNKEKITDWIIIVALLVMLVMAVLPLLGVNLLWMRWVYAAAAVAVLVAKLCQRYRGRNLRVKRLHRIGQVSAVLYCASAAMLFYSKDTNDWVAFLLAGAVLQTYAAYMIDHENKKVLNSD